MSDTPDPAVLDAVAADVYAVVPGDFTATRARCAAADPASADAIRSWRKPTVAAWVVNVLSRRPELAEALSLADEIRRTSADRDGRELARLGAQRRSIVASIVTLAITTAAAEGVALSRAAQDDVAATVNAALGDPAAAAAVLSGRLIRPLAPGGFGDVDLDGALAGSVPTRSSLPEDRVSTDGPRRGAERALREAEQSAAEAQRELSRIDGRLTLARDRAARLRDRADALRSELRRAESEAESAAADALSLDRDRTDTVSRVRESVRATVAARGRLGD